MLGKFFPKRLFFLFLLPILLQSFASAEQGNFFLISPPKSGTHMATKLLELMTAKKKAAIFTLKLPLVNLPQNKFNMAIEESAAKNIFVYGHTNPEGYAPFFKSFAQTHPRYTLILPIRDLRSLLLSFVFHKREVIAREMKKPNATIEEMLAFLLNPNISPCGKALEGNISYATTLLSLSNTFRIRFEDCVGPRGGGTRARQKKTILALAKRLQLSLTPQRVDYIAENLFGNESTDQNNLPIPRSGTFRKGRIDEWRTYFKTEHKKLFKEYWGTYQRAWGYPVNN